MDPQYFQLGATAVVAIAAFKFGETIVKSFTKRNNKEEISRMDANQQSQIDVLTSLMNSHFKANEESFAVVHNGLNSTAQSMKDINITVNSLRIMIEKLATIIDERIPKKQ